MCIVCMLGSIFWNVSNSQKYQYFIEVRYGGIAEGILTFFTVYILLNTMIPISLIISLEMVKFTQAYFIDNDLDMRDESGEFSKTFNSALNEELGQIEYIFTDKTGTLTKNMMEFVFCIVGDTGFGNPEVAQHKEANQLPLCRLSTYINKKAGVQYSFDNPRLKELILKETPGKEENLSFLDFKGKCIYRVDNL